MDTKKKEKTTGRGLKQTFASSSGYPVQGRGRQHRKNRLPFELSKLGQPDGKDDPLTNGISVEEVRKYLRHDLQPKKKKTAVVKTGRTQATDWLFCLRITLRLFWSLSVCPPWRISW